MLTLKLTLLFISISVVCMALKMPNKKQSNIIDAEWEEVTDGQTNKRIDVFV